MVGATSTSSHSEQGSHNSSRFVNLKLYGFWRSSSTWRIQIVLAAKSIPFTFHSIDILNGQSKEEDYATNVNAMKQVPVLECIDTAQNVDNDPNGDTGRIRITQSLAIIEFIEEAFVDDGFSLLPTDAVDRARVREIAEIVNSGIQPLQNLSVMDMIDEFGKGHVETKLGNGKFFGKHHIEKGLKAIESLVNAQKMLKNQGGHFAIGSSNPTLADAFIVPQMYNARRFFVDLEATCPSLLEVEAHCLQHPWFSETHPDVIRGLYPYFAI